MIDAGDNKLSIQVSLYGLSLLIRKAQENQMLHVSFDEPAGLDLAEKVRDELNTLNIRLSGYNKVQVFHHHPFHVFVPESFYDKNKEKSYLQYNIKVFKSDVTQADDIKPLEAKNVYLPFVHLNNYLLEQYPDFEYFHSATAFLEFAWKDLNQNNRKHAVYIRLFSNDFQMAVFKDRKWIFFNTFSLEKPDDLLYYFFFIWEELQLDGFGPEILIVSQTDENTEFIDALKDFRQGMQVLDDAGSEILGLYL